MTDVPRALLRALVSQLHPRMLWLAFWPFLLALLAWGGLAWWYREDLLALLTTWLNQLTLVGWIDSLLSAVGIASFKVFLVPLVFLGLLIPLILVTALLIIALLAMPLVIEHVARRNYPDLARSAGSGFANGWLSVLNSLWVSAVFVLGWVATMPLWLIAPLSLLLPLLWWAWLTARLLRLDSLLEHATAAERAILIDRHRRGYLMLGLFVSLLNFIPPLFLLAPVYSGLAFTHFSLHALARLRAEGRASGASAGAGPEPVAPTAPGTVTVRDMGPVEIVSSAAAGVAPSRPEALPGTSADHPQTRSPS